jgi:hypothetical protein
MSPKHGAVLNYRLAEITVDASRPIKTCAAAREVRFATTPAAPRNGVVARPWRLLPQSS